MMSTHGRFTCIRAFTADGHTFAAGDPLDTDHAELIRLLLESGKIEPRDDRTRRHIEWRELAQWAPAPERTRGGYRAVNW